MTNNKKLLGNMMLTLTALIWGTAFVFQRTGMDSIEPITFNAVRMVLASVLVGGLALFLREREKRSAGRVWDSDAERIRLSNTIKGGIFCGLFLSAGTVLQQMGLVYTSAGKAGFITTLYMILVPVINFLLFKKRNPFIVWLAVVMGIGGLYLLCVKEDFALTKGDALIIACAFMFAGQILCADKYVQKSDPVGLSAMQFVVGAVTGVPAALILENPTWQGIAAAAIPILYCGVLSSSAGYTLQIVGQKYTDPTVASLILSMESVFAVIAGALFLGERMDGREMLGCIIMFAAIILVQLPAPAAKKSDKQEG